MEKLLKLNVYWLISIGAIWKSTSGIVILNVYFKPFAPSMLAASYRSFGIAWSTPVVSRKI